MQITTVGLDIAKNVFQVHGIDAAETVATISSIHIDQRPLYVDHNSEGRITMNMISVVGSLLGLLSAIGVSWPSSAQQPIRIGASIAVTGRDNVQGGYVREGYLLCQKQVNEKGGVLGRPIEFLIRDDGSEPKTAVGLYEKLIVEDKVDAVMGPYGSASTERRGRCHGEAPEAHDCAGSGHDLDLGERAEIPRHGTLAPRRRHRGND